MARERVGFDGVADEVVAGGEGGLEEAEALGDLVGGVDVERGAVGLSEAGEVHAAAVQAAIAVEEGTNGGLPGAWWPSAAWT